MRVWLIEDRPAARDNGSFEALLRQLATRPDTGLVLQHAGPFLPDHLPEMRLRSPEVVVLHEASAADAGRLGELLGLEVAVVVATAPDQCEGFLALAVLGPVVFIPVRPGVDCLWMALVSAGAAQRRALNGKQEIERLQQRLNDRIIIERAKGVLVKRLAISEEEAYKRLRMLSRRQRRQIRDIAQSLLDTQSLLSPEPDGMGAESLLDLPVDGLDA